MAAVPLKAANVQFIVIHCSASKPDVKVDAAVIDRWHRQRGFLKIGYHFVIKRDGAVEEGRALTEVGAHAIGHNSRSIGICLAGGLDKAGKPLDNFTLDQYAALAELVIKMRQRFPNAQVLGHRDLPNVRKDCPCFDVKKWVQETIDGSTNTFGC